MLKNSSTRLPNQERGLFATGILNISSKYLLIRRLEILIFQLALHHICLSIYQRQELVKLKRLASCMESIPIHRLPPEHHPVHDMFQRQMPVQQVPQGVLYIKHHGKHQRRTNQCGSFKILLRLTIQQRTQVALKLFQVLLPLTGVIYLWHYT